MRPCLPERSAHAHEYSAVCRLLRDQGRHGQRFIKPLGRQWSELYVNLGHNLMAAYEVSSFGQPCGEAATPHDRNIIPRGRRIASGGAGSARQRRERPDAHVGAYPHTSGGGATEFETCRALLDFRAIEPRRRGRRVRRRHRRGGHAGERASTTKQSPRDERASNRVAGAVRESAERAPRCDRNREIRREPGRIAAVGRRNEIRRRFRPRSQWGADAAFAASGKTGSPRGRKGRQSRRKDRP